MSKYDDEAVSNGFEPLIAFQDIYEIYESQALFPAFSSRLPDRRRKDIKEILVRYKLERYDAFELLKKSGGKLPTDTLEFIDPIFPDEANIEREFYIAGVRNQEYCNGNYSNIKFKVEINDELILERDIDNIYDKFAVKIINMDNRVIEFIPAFYSKEVSHAIERGRQTICKVISNECENNCEGCIKVKLIID